jgi:hypothetical protein
MHLDIATWVVGLICAVAGAGIYEFTKYMARRLESMHGSFSGQYIALTGNLDGGPIIVEFANCRHFVDNLRGTIEGIANIEFDSTTGKIHRIADNNASYQFDGFVDGRVLVISYRSKIRRVQSSGSVALKGDDVGAVFLGAWAGLDDGMIVNTPCVWIRHDTNMSTKKEDLFIQAQKYLDNSDRFMVKGQPNIGKHMLVNTLKAALLDPAEMDPEQKKERR